MIRLPVVGLAMLLLVSLLGACAKPAAHPTASTLKVAKGQACAAKGDECVRPTLSSTPEEPTPIPPANFAPDQFVIDLAVVHSPNGPGVACPAGYEKRQPDLNEDAGGEWVYLCL